MFITNGIVFHVINLKFKFLMNSYLILGLIFKISNCDDFK